MANKPVLSIGIIFKNEIRCLERCVKSLQPLRDAIPCELVMADTGSFDGSREIAERYADVFFDFPWINDFSAARNAVMDRSSGEWYFSIDADEWLDEDIKELAGFFTTGGKERFDICGLMERNYQSYDLAGGYGTFIPWRLVRMSTGMRYEGAIHEHWSLGKLRKCVLRKTVIHHDGYVGFNESAAGREKRERNMALLRQRQEADPEDLLAYLQFIESGRSEVDFEWKLRKAVELVGKRVPTWDTMGPPIFRYGIQWAVAGRLPETEEWIRKAEELFPESYFIRLDAAFIVVAHYLKEENYAECARWGEKYLEAWKDYQAGRGDLAGQMFSGLLNATPKEEARVRILTSRACFETGRADEAVAVLSGVDCTLLDAQWTENLLKSLQLFHFMGAEGASAQIAKMWEDIQLPSPNQEWAEKRVECFLRQSVSRFDPDFIRSEPRRRGFRRPAYTLYTPLKGKHILGTAAAMLESDSPAEMEELMGLVEKWEDLPFAALTHALETGVRFPPAGYTMSLEEMSRLAARLAKNPDSLRKILARTAEEDFAGSWQTLAWAQCLVLAAVQVCDWKDESAGLELARTFAKVERIFISGCYAPEVLREGNLFVLPPMHRFGWYCAQAFDALEIGDTVGYVRFLREGLGTCGDMKPMVDFLTKYTPELQGVSHSQELLELAEKVRTMLAAYPADDPAVAAIKASPIYQKVAQLIEG